MYQTFFHDIFLGRGEREGGRGREGGKMGDMNSNVL